MNESYRFGPMTRDYAKEIAAWSYPEPYSFYDMDNGEESIAELLNGGYQCVLDENGELSGFVCAGDSARVPGGYTAGIYNEGDSLDIGLGLRPDLTGIGKGTSFLREAVAYIELQYRPQRLRLAVARFNRRAIRAYEKAGFRHGRIFDSPVDGSQVEFVAMERESSWSAAASPGKDC